jgi:pimeloyl-ACP methyl ester carboxylesterase
MKVLVQQNQAYIYTGTKSIDPTKPSIIMVHGAQHDHSVWILQSRYFAHHGFNVIAVDLPGHGKSAGKALHSVEAIAQWLLELITALGITQTHWVGHSMGSLAVLEAASRAPEKTMSLVLIGTAFPMRVSDVLLNAARDDEAQAFTMINFWSHSRLAHQPGSPGPGFSVFNQNKRLMERQVPGVLLNDFSACNAYEGGLVAAKNIASSTLFLLGEQDAMTPPKAATNLFNSIEGAKKEIIANCGHALMAERPDKVLAALKNHFNLSKSAQ